MSLILKEESANSVPTPPAGKGTIFLSDTDVLTVKLANGATQGFPTVGGSNTQVFFNDQGALQGNANFTFNKTTGLLTTPLLTVQGNATVDGDLVVNGNITYINVTTFAVEDPIIELGGGPNGNALTSNDGYDRGTLLHYYTSAPVDAFMGWDTSNAEFAMGSNVTVASNVITFNTLGNLRVGGLKTDNLYYSNGSPWDLQQPAGSNTQLQFNNAGDFGASANLTFDTATNNLTVTGNINATSNVLAQNLNANGVVSATGNISGANITTGGILTATGNIGGGNLNSVGVVSATGNVIGGNITTVGQLVSTKGTGAPIVVSSSALVANLNADLLDGFNTDGAATANTIAVRNADGNLVANYFIGNGSQLTGIDATSIQNGNSNVKVEANSNVNISVAGTANVIQVSATGVKVTGTLESTGNANVNFLTATGNITGNHLQASNTLGVTGNANVGNLGVGGEIITIGNVSGGNLTTGGVVSATGNVSGGNLTTGGGLSVTGNANIGNIGTAGLVTATGNVSGGNLTTGGVVTATGNVSGGNLTTGGALSVTGNANVGNIGATGGVFTTVAGTLTTASQPNVTSLGTLTSLAVTGNVTSGNVSGGNLVSANYLTGTLTTAAQPNITSVGSLSSLTVTGNANAGNIGTSGLIVATGNVSGGNLTTGGALSVTGNANVGNLGTTGVFATTVSATGNANVGNIGTTALIATGTGSFGGNVNMNTNYINNLGTPVLSSDAATKQYVDDLASTALTYHEGVTAATTTTLAVATGGTTAYNSPNGASNGIGAYISTTGTFNLIDTANVQTVGTRILVKNEANATWNGVYTYTNATAITRALDADEYGPNSATSLSLNDYFFVSGGNVNKGSAYVCDTAGTITFGTTNINFAQFSSSQIYSNGVGLNLSGTTFSLANTAVTAATYGNGDRVATFTVDAQGRLTAASNTVSAANAANLTGTTLASGIVTSSLTTVGTLGTLSVTGNANVGNLGTAQVLASANVTAPQFVSNVATGTSPITVLSTTKVANLNADLLDGYDTATAATANTVVVRNADGNITGNNIAGTLSTAAQTNITSLGTLTGLGVNGTITGVNITANTGVFTGNGSGLSAIAGANVTGTVPSATAATNASALLQNTSTSTTVYPTFTTSSANGNSQAVFNTGISANLGNSSITATTFVGALSGAATTAGTVTTAAQPNITSVGTLTSLGVSGAVTASTLVSNVATGTAPLTVTSTTQVANLSVATAGSATTAGTVTTAAQPNITSVGTLTGLGVNGTITGVNITANTGVFTGNANGISSVQAGNLVGTTLSSTVVTSSLTTVGTLGSLAVTANVTAGNVYANSGTGGFTTLTASGNITAGNVYANSGTGGFTTLTASGNVSGANVVASTYDITGTTTGISAAGSTQGTGTALTKAFNVVSTVSSGQGVVLPTAVAGMRITIINTSATSLNVYPASGGTVNALATNAAFSLPTLGRLDFVATSTTQWYTMGAIYV